MAEIKISAQDASGTAGTNQGTLGKFCERCHKAVEHLNAEGCAANRRADKSKRQQPFQLQLLVMRR